VILGFSLFEQAGAVEFTVLLNHLAIGVGDAPSAFSQAELLRLLLGVVQSPEGR